ncbi:Protein HOS4 [Diplonema papillatum]|nr:Protein HOS4 [Diplonema papillatum]
MSKKLSVALDAVFRGDLVEVKKSVDVSLIDKTHPQRGTTLLYTACRFGHDEVVQWLIEKGADVNKRNSEEGSGSTPLHGAAFGGHSSILVKLLSAGADIAVENDYGDTAANDAGEPHENVTAAKKKACKKIMADAAKALPNKKAALGSKVGQKRAATEENEDDQQAPQTKKVKKAPVPKKTSTMQVAEEDEEEEETQASNDKKKAGSPSKKVKVAPVSKKISMIQAADEDEEMAEEEETSSKPKKPSPKKDKKVAKKDGGGKEISKEEKKPISSPKKAAAPKALSKKEKEAALKAKVKASAEELDKASVTLTPVARDDQAFWDLEEKFAANMQGRNDDYNKNRVQAKLRPLTFILKSAEKVHNPVLEARFQRTKKQMMEKYPEDKKKWRERVSFHGTSEKNLKSILRTSLLRFKHPLNPCKEQSDDGWFGTNRKGVYVSKYADYTFKYSFGGNPLDVGDRAKIIMFKTLPGESKHIPEVKTGMEPTDGFDSHSSPNYLEWYLFDESQLCPEYVLEVQAAEDTRTLADDE